MRRERGSNVVEYCLLLAAIAVATVSIFALRSTVSFDVGPLDQPGSQSDQRFSEVP